MATSRRRSQLLRCLTPTRSNRADCIERSHLVIVAYKPKPGKEADLLQLNREHVPLLRSEGLATDHPVTACQAKDGTIVEAFARVPGGAERAHSNPQSAPDGPATPPPATSFPSPRYLKRHHVCIVHPITL